MDAYISSDPNDQDPADVEQGPATTPSTTAPPDISTAPLPSPSTQAAAPPLHLPDVLGSMFGDHDFQSASPEDANDPLSIRPLQNWTPIIKPLSADQKSAYVTEVLKTSPFQILSITNG